MSDTSTATKDDVLNEERNALRDSGLESWKNVTASRLQLWRIGDFGVERAELIPAGKVVALTPAERRLNENKVAREKDNPFTNGRLRPLDLIETDRDYERLMANPNVLTDDDITKLFKLKAGNLQARLQQITHPAAIERLMEEGVARDITVGQQAILHQRLTELGGFVTSSTGETIEAVADSPERPAAGNPVGNQNGPRPEIGRPVTPR